MLTLQVKMLEYKVTFMIVHQEQECYRVYLGTEKVQKANLCMDIRLIQ